MIKLSVPGKIHLLGEHSVVYGKPALLSAINLRVYLTLSSQKKEKVIPVSRIHPKSGKPDDSNSLVPVNDIIKLQQVLEKTIKKKFKIIHIPPYQISINSELPIGSGLGSSAAISVGITASLLSLLKVKWDKNLIYEIAFEGEKIFHGNPSGGDVAACLYGGLIWFSKETEFLKTISPRPLTLHSNLKHFFLIDSGKPVENTKEMVELVRVRRQKSRVRVEKIFDSQEELTKQLVQALKEKTVAKIIQIIKAGERNLENLGVVGNLARKIIGEIEKNGGVAKITGGGGVKEGSGMLLAYHNHPKVILKIAQNNGWKTFAINLGEEGLRND